MKNILLVILAAMVLGAVLPGCHHEPRYDSRLTAADSLMQKHPDSALAILKALSPNSSSPARGEVARSDGGGGVEFSNADKAYHALLLTQARYKCYVTATSDSNINLALAYFRTHPADREKLTRAYIYKGAVMEELGHPDSAMLYYKTAEANAASDDYYNLGYSNLRIAQLYQSNFANDSAVVTRMKTAARYFMAVNDTNYLITAIGTQGAYPKILGEDSARIYLKKAILLSKEINSPKGLQYQSKLVGRYFYSGDYMKAKELAMDIVRNGGDQSNEQQFYYYAARSYVQLHILDSARRVMSMIPSPKNVIDSMNLYQLMAEISKAAHHYDDFARYSEKAKRIDTRILENSRNSQLVETELKWDAIEKEKNARSEADSHWGAIICLILVTIALLAVIAVRVYNHRIRDYRKRLDGISQELEKMLAETDEYKLKLEAIHENYRLQIIEKNDQLAEESQKRLELEQSSLNSQVSSIVRYRHAALNELYQSVRIKSVTSDGKKRVVPLFGVIKELLENRRILNSPLPKSFWDNLKLSVDGEFRGIASFVEQQYPKLTERDLQLFMLLCANVPNHIIKICMNYTHDVTVSKYKKRLIKERIGLDIKFEEFIDLYLQGKLTNFG